jgi:hypothetical protein
MNLMFHIHSSVSRVSILCFVSAKQKKNLNHIRLIVSSFFSSLDRQRLYIYKTTNPTTQNEQGKKLVRKVPSTLCWIQALAPLIRGRGIQRESTHRLPHNTLAVLLMARRSDAGDDRVRQSGRSNYPCLRMTSAPLPKTRRQAATSIWRRPRAMTRKANITLYEVSLCATCDTGGPKRLGQCH